MALLYEPYINSTVSISTKTVEGKKVILGTGFIYADFVRVLDASQNQNIYTYLLVTCKHVIEGSDKIFITIGHGNEEIELDIVKYKEGIYSKTFNVWHEHPSNEDYDLAVIPINFPHIKSKIPNADYFRSDTQIASTELIKDLGVSEGDSVFILGYPNVFKDANNNDVAKFIARSGIIANLEPLLKAESNEFIIDSLIFPGNSGGPVILKFEKQSIQGTKPQVKSCLIGMVTNYYSHREKAFSQISNEEKILFEDNSGLVSIYPLDPIAETSKFIFNSIRNYLQSLIDEIRGIANATDLKNYIIEANLEVIQSTIQKYIIRVDYSQTVVDELNSSINNPTVKEKLLEDYLDGHEKLIDAFRKQFSLPFIDEYLTKEELEEINKLIDDVEEKFGKISTN